MSSSPFHYSNLLAKYSDGIPCPRDFSFPTHVLDKWAAKDPSLVALHWCSADFTRERKLSYAELRDESIKAARVFDGLGIRKGDKVMMQLPKVLEWWIAVLGLQRIGAIPIPGTSLLVSKDLKTRAEASKASAFIGCKASCTTFEEIAADVGVKTVIQVLEDGDELGRGRIDFLERLEATSVDGWTPPSKLVSSDLAMIYFTSGTTGMPKMVLLDAQYLLGHTITGLWYKLQPGRTLLNLGDLGWAKAAYATFGTFNVGGSLFVQPPTPGAFDPYQLLEALHRYSIHTLCCPPTAYRGLLTTAAKKYYASHPPKALAECVSAGEPVNGPVISAWRSLTSLTIRDGWGQTETTPVVSNFEGVEVREGSMGKPAPGFEVGVLGEDGEVEVGDEGELCIRTDKGAGSRWIFKGYLKNGELNKAERTVDGKTWYCTGDRGRKDKDGYYWFIGRSDDVITSSGYRIGPFEVESTLKEHPAVLESAVVASPHLERLEIVKAFIIPATEFEGAAFGDAGDTKKLVEELQEHCRKRAAPYKYPREIEFVRVLPKTVSGKITRRELRNLEYQRKSSIVSQLKIKL